MAKLIFWISLISIIYTYAGYPLWLALLVRVRPKPVRKSPFEPTVSVVISAFNEEVDIVRRVLNLLAQDYPVEKLDIVIVSDGSTDRTVELLRPLVNDRLTLIELPANRGKAVALNTGLAEARGEITIFADARQTFAIDAVRHLTANFSDSSIGCVSGELIFYRNTASSIQAEMGAYWKYEKWIRKTEGRTGSTVGATGAIYAIRRDLFRPLPANTLLDDVLTPLNVVRQGYRCIFDGLAVAVDKVSKDAGQEWRRKVRTLAGNWQMLSMFPELLLPWRNPICWRFLSHKIMRLIVPFGMFSLFVSGVLIDGELYRAATGVQLLFFAISLVGLLIPSIRAIRLVSLSYFFLVMNTAAVVGFLLWVTGRSATAWQPATSCKNGISA
jgi:cellulose synthase/poly-beta-1,6-N-acetylglucosamine synthase-like glycosyltransferase